MGITTAAEPRGRARLQIGAVGASAVAAVLYLLIGIGALDIGRSTSGEAPDLLAFGLMTGSTFAVIAVLLARFRSRLLWAAVAVLQVLVIVMYFVIAAQREPPVELWGLLIKACQAIVLVAVCALLFGRAEEARPA